MHDRNADSPVAPDSEVTVSPDRRRFLDDLLLTPSPTGDEQRIQRLIADRMRDVAESIGPDTHGNLILGLNTAAKRRVMLAGHCDQLGFVVKYINASGYLYLDALGGVDFGTLLGERVTLHTKNGPLPGVIGRKPIHLQSSQDMTQIPTLNNMWLDIGAHGHDEAAERVQLGDYVTVSLGVTELLGQRISAPGLDNKAGLFVCLETLRRCAAQRLNVALYVVSTVQEEIGSRGAQTAAYAIDPDIGIAVDVVNATDDPSPSSPQQQVTCLLGAGPALSSGPGTNPVIQHLLQSAAADANIPTQPAPTAQTAGNDSKPIQVARRGIATASIGIPQRSMHTQAEICCLRDIENSIRLLTEFLTSLPADPDLLPFNFNP